MPCNLRSIVGCDVGVGLLGVIVDNTILALCAQKLCLSGAESRKVPRQLVFVNGRLRALERLLRRLSRSVPLNRAFIHIVQVPHVLYGSAWDLCSFFSYRNKELPSLGHKCSGY